jgi:hypothetical protein
MLQVISYNICTLCRNYNALTTNSSDVDLSRLIISTGVIHALIDDTPEHLVDALGAQFPSKMTIMLL